ncbi:VUT family protein, partial [Paenibacillus rhizolycopersici]|uniref:VUT family protein n=1 Tax=Paenibacillus rhizolycopersici TaxID=2780073 RepID=UPI003D283D1A
IASAISFLLSESADTEMFTRLRATLAKRVMFSGVIGSVIDSVIFTLIAGFPWNAAYGQLIVKVGMQALVAAALMKQGKKKYA